jgi:hypothetical protein
MFACSESPGGQAMPYGVIDRGDMGYTIVYSPHVHYKVALPPYIITFIPLCGIFVMTRLYKRSQSY